MERRKLKAIQAPYLSRQGEERYVLRDEKTGEIVDNAGGYGYLSASGAHRAYCWKHKSRKKEEERLLQDWMKEHPDLVQEIRLKRIELIRRGKGKLFNSENVKKYLKQKGYEKLPFEVSDLLRKWRRL